MTLPPDVAAFLQQPGQLAVLATLEPSGFPHQTPVWYLLADAAIWVWMRRHRRKFRNLARHSPVSLYIQAVDDVHRGVTLQGRAEPQAGECHERFEQIARRYVRSDELEIWVAHMHYGRNALVRIAPSWFARNGSSWNL